MLVMALEPTGRMKGLVPGDVALFEYSTDSKRSNIILEKVLRRAGGFRQ